jgi:hypothetical protein
VSPTFFNQTSIDLDTLPLNGILAAFAASPEPEDDLVTKLTALPDLFFNILSILTRIHKKTSYQINFATK